MEFIHIERLRKIGVGTAFQSFQTVTDFGLRGQQNNGNVTDIGIALDFLQQRDTIHLRHQHIRNHKVVFTRKQGF